MNTNLPKIWRQALVWLNCLILISLDAFGQTKIPAPETSTHFWIPGHYADSLLRNSKPFQSRKFVCIRMANPVDDSIISSLKRLGIQTLSIQNKKIIEVSLPQNIAVSSLLQLPIESISPISTHQKISQELQSWLQEVHSENDIQIALVPQKGLKETTIREQWNPEWGQWVETWKGDRPQIIIKCTDNQLNALLGQPWVRWMEMANHELIPFNTVAASNARVRSMSNGWTGSLSGLGVNVAVGDGGMVETHADLESVQENNTAQKLASFADHQDHVTGTIAGKGLLQADKKGMAPGSRILNLQTSGTISNGHWLRENEQVSLTNNSYGQSLVCERAGGYNATSSFMDDQANQIPDLLHVVAAGNQGGNQCNGFPPGFQTIAEGYPVAKNVLTVGAVLGKDEFAWFSSMGPVKDGRVKPEIVADGNDVFSTIPMDQYGAKGGTSMATPVVTGTLALLTQRFKQMNNGLLPDGALLKAIVCNSAEDLGRPGVDFANGFGRLNGRRARQILENQNYFQGTISSNGLLQFQLTAPDNAQGLKIMLSWTDPSANPSDPKALVHDLNLKVKNGASQVFLPWILNPHPDQVDQPATRGIDTLNSLEQVSLPVFGGEPVTIFIDAGTLLQNQKFWVVYQWENPELVLTSPFSGENLRSMQSYCFRWDQCQLNINQLQIESSTDSIEWQTFKTISQPNKLAADFSLPNTSFQKIWYRLKANTNIGTIYSSPVACFLGKQLTISHQVCQTALKLSWTSMQDADKYQILQLDPLSGIWREKDFTFQPQYWVGSLEPGKRYAFAIKPWFGNQPGFQSDARVIITDATSPCPWMDVAITGSAMPDFYRPGTSHASSGPLIPVTAKVKNIGNQELVGGNLTIRCQFPDGHIAEKILTTGLQPGESSTIPFDENLNVETPGTFPLRFWLVNSTDFNKANDSLKIAIRSVSNPHRNLPILIDFGNIQAMNLSESQLGSGGLVGLDFESVNGARISTDLPQTPANWGNGGLILDKARVDGKTGIASAIFTLNLAGNSIDQELMLFFDIIPFGIQGPGNALYVRANDQENWQEVLSFSNANLPVGQVSSYQSINLVPFLQNQNPGSSFQIRFSFSGQRPATMWNPNGYAINNISLMIPSRDVVIKRLLSPNSQCVDQSSQKVKIRIFNEKEETAEQIRIGYSTGPGHQVEQMIPSLGAHDSLDVEFETKLPAGLLGQLKLKCWSMAQGDVFPVNDTLKTNQIYFSPIIQQFPYYQSFETNDGYWKSYGKKNSWEWGKPSPHLKVLDSAANGKLLWATNLSGNYQADELSFLQSPCFNVSALPGDVQFSFHSKFDTEPDYDFVWLEYSEDGKNWKKLGSKGHGTNWYNHDSQHWNGKQGRWQTVSFRLPSHELDIKTRIQFRFGFQSDLSNQAEGMAIDDIHIEPAIEIGQTMKAGMKWQNQVVEGDWLRLGTDDGRCAEIKGGNHIPGLSMEGNLNEERVRSFGYSPYLDRNFVLVNNLENNDETLLRFFITEKDLKQMESSIPGLPSFQGLGIYQYQGINMDLQPDNNAFPLGKSRFFPAQSIVKVPTSGGYYLEFSAQPQGEFYITQGTFDHGETPLPIQLIEWKASRANPYSAVTLSWKTSYERNCDYFEISYSLDGQNFQPFETQKAKGGPNLETQYYAKHQSPTSFGPIWYRLSQYDIGAEKPTNFTTILRTRNPEFENLTWVNPFGNKIQWFGKISPESQIFIRDETGRLIWNGTINESQNSIMTGDWAKGLYLIQMMNPDGPSTVKLIKE